MQRSARTTQTSLFIAVNGDRTCLEAPGYHGLHVGRALASHPIGTLGDDTGDHISRLNGSFCELTGLYWMWKNNNSQIVGLMHYRRYFGPRQQPGIAFGGGEVAQASDFTEIAEGIDLVVPMPMRWFAQEEIPESLLGQWARAHTPYDLFLARDEMLRQTPEYRDAWDFAMGLNAISHHNMFVGRKVVVDEYCAWLFPILFALEPLIPYEFYDPYQHRVFGFIAERLFNVWLCHNRRRFRILARGLVRTEAGIL